MNKIQFSANKDTNYIFHMLSVSKCGYDNAYGEAYRHFYPDADLQLLWDNKELLTVSGGSHCGALYWLMVCRPACGECSAKEYYRSLLHDIANHRLERKYLPFTSLIQCLSNIMIQHYDFYISHIWPAEEKKILDFIQPIQEYFQNSDFTDRAEALLGSHLECSFFTATMVSSVENGPEAIDISKSQDVFGIERSFWDSVYFIGHEYIIYLLFGALKHEDAFHRFETWPLTEGLAEFYLKKIMGDSRFFQALQNYVAFFEQCDTSGTLSAPELYRLALEAAKSP